MLAQADFTRDDVLAWRSRDRQGLLPAAGDPLERAGELVRRAGLVSVFTAGELPSLYRADGSALTTSFETAWELADRLSAGRRAFYGKLFRGKTTLVAPELLPWLWAALRRDAEAEYRDGRLGQTAARIYRHLRQGGPLPADRLRRQLGFHDRGGAAAFRRGLEELEAILAVAVVDRVRVHWDTFVWGPAEDWLAPGDREDYARVPPRLGVGRTLMAVLERARAAPLADIERWFRWPAAEVRGAVRDLAAAGSLALLEIRGFRGPCAALPG